MRIQKVEFNCKQWAVNAQDMLNQADVLNVRLGNAIVCAVDRYTLNGVVNAVYVCNGYTLDDNQITDYDKHALYTCIKG